LIEKLLNLDFTQRGGHFKGLLSISDQQDSKLMPHQLPSSRVLPHSWKEEALEHYDAESPNGAQCEDVLPMARSAVAIGPRCIRQQIGVLNTEAEVLA
jgi:hypothetical protein